MSRAKRLLDLIQLLRRHRFAVSGSAMAEELGISLRTLYRDIATLQSQGASIDGAPGLGYVLRDGFVLPPMMFTADEIEALVLGARWVADRGDARLGAAAKNALSKIAAVLPAPLRHELDSNALLVGPGAAMVAGEIDGADIRRAIRLQNKLDIVYRDGAGKHSARTIWPFALGYFDHAKVVVAWCELRKSIRHFRADRIVTLALQPVRYPQSRQALLKAWREREDISEK